MRRSTRSAAPALERTAPADVCIIGSGPAGAVLGRDLVARGIRTVMVESGTTLLRWLCDNRLRQLAAYEVSGDTAYPRQRTRARALGGTSHFWTGRSERFQPSDFEESAYAPEGASWPLRYRDLEAYYERAEQTLRVRGSDLSHHYPPRRNNLPLPARNDISILKEMMAEVGVTVDCSPTATPRKGWRIFRFATEILPEFVASANALLLAGWTVTRLVPDRNGRIIGARARTTDGSERTIIARYYVVACGGIESPRLLLLSRSPEFPNGIGNSRDRVGRGFNEHAGVNLYGRVPHRRGTLRPHYRMGRTHQFYDAFRSDGLGSVLPVFIQASLFPNHLMSFRPGAVPRAMLAMVSRFARPELYIGATIEMRPDDANRVTLADGRRDRFGDPLAHLHFSFTDEDRRTLNRTRELIRGIYVKLDAQDIREGELTWSRHHIGTCRMGDDPNTSVTNRDLRVHDSPNLYVCGSEVFVTGGAVPPVLTITALAHRLADHLTEQVRPTQ